MEFKVICKYTLALLLIFSQNSWAFTVEDLSKTIVYLRKLEPAYEFVGGEKREIWVKIGPNKDDLKQKKTRNADRVSYINTIIGIIS